MKEGDLVTIRLGETGTMRVFLPGLVVTKCHRDKRDEYLIFAAGDTYWVTDKDLGPVDLALEITKRRKNERSSGKA